MSNSQYGSDPPKVQLQEQLQACNEKISAGEPTAVTYFQRGTVYAGLSSLAEAVEDFTQAIALSPDYLEAFEARARLYELTNLQEQAIEDLNRVVEIDPLRHQAHLRLGDIHLQRQNYLASIAAYTRALLLDGSLWESYRSRALARTGAAEYSGAVEDYSRAIELASHRGELFAGRGNAHLANQDRAAAIEDFRTAILLYGQSGRPVVANEILNWIESPPID